MLRKAFKRPKPDSGLIGDKSGLADPDGAIVGDKSSKRWHGQQDLGLEKIVFSGSEDIINNIEDRTKHGKKRDLETEQKAAWKDDSETTEKSSSKVSSTPTWARLDVQREEEDVDILHRAGDVLVKSSLLPKGILQIKKINDANADDTREGRLQNVEFHPSAKVILTAGTTQRLNLFQIDGRNNSKIQSVYFEDYPIHTAHFRTDGDEIIVGSHRKNFLFYDMVAGKIMNVPKIKALEGCNMARFEVSPDGRYLAFLGKYGSIHLISAKTKEWIGTLKMNGDVHCLSFTSDGSKMFSYGDTGTVFIWDMNARTCVHTFIDEGCVQGTSVASSPNDQYIACGSQSGIVNIYNQESCLQQQSPKPLKSIMNLTTSCNKARFNCSSEILAITSSEAKKAIKLVHFPSMHVFSNFPEMTDRQLQIPQCLDFSPNGGYMAIGNQKGHALLYRLGHYSMY